MLLIMYRMLLAFIEMSCLPLAALIILGYSPKTVWRNALICGALVAGISNLTYLIPIDGIRHPVNWIITLIVFKVVFRLKWWDSIKLLITVIFAMFPTTIGWLILDWITGPSEYMPERYYAIGLVIMPVVYIANICLAILLRRIGSRWAYLLVKIKANPQDMRLFVAVILQTVLLFFYAEVSFIGINPVLQRDMLYVSWGLITGINIFIVYTSIRSRERKIMDSAGATISSHVASLMNSVRSQRHDFSNHLQVISALHYNQQRDELTEYLAGLNSEVSFYNDVMKIDNPFIAALVNAKIAVADGKQIRMETNFMISLAGMKSNVLDIVRILGNLLDNAIEAVGQQDIENRWVRLRIDEKGPFLVFEVSNPGNIEPEMAASLFQPGFTSKDEKHAGLGLYSARELARKIGGHLEYAGGAQVTFSLLIPR